MSLKDETIKLKLSKSHTLLSEIDVLWANKFYNTVVSRLYYSCFHATKALLLTKDLMPKTHKGTSITLHEHLVYKGLFDAAKAAFFDKLMTERIEDDYNDFIILDKKEVVDFIQPAKEYVQYISNLVDEYFDLQSKESTSD